jgi:hypothetical protein
VWKPPIGCAEATYEDACLHAGRDTGALEDDVDLAHAVDLTDLGRDLLGYSEALVDILPSARWHSVAAMCERVVDRKSDPSRIDVRDDHLPGAP